jgi:putative ABC transport system substrate-binding protein
VAETIVRDRPDALALAPTVINFNLRREIAEFANAQRLPTVGANRDQAVAGFLISYGSESDDLYRHVAVYVDKILKGAKPVNDHANRTRCDHVVRRDKAARSKG